MIKIGKTLLAVATLAVAFGFFGLRRAKAGWSYGYNNYTHNYNAHGNYRHNYNNYGLNRFYPYYVFRNYHSYPHYYGYGLGGYFMSPYTIWY